MLPCIETAYGRSIDHMNDDNKQQQQRDKKNNVLEMLKSHCGHCTALLYFVRINVSLFFIFERIAITCGRCVRFSHIIERDPYLT